MFSQVPCIERYLAISGKARKRGTDARGVDIQLKKGALDLCVLALLSRADNYAYEIASRLAEAIGMGEGTIYPLMRRMQADGLVETYLVEFVGRTFAQILPSDRRGPGKPGGADRGLAQLRRRRPIHPWGGVTHMTRQEFIARLKAGLAGLPLQAQADIVADYETHFTEGAAAGRSEADIAAALGDPERLARELRAEAGLKRWETRAQPRIRGGRRVRGARSGRDRRAGAAADPDRHRQRALCILLPGGGRLLRRRGDLRRQPLRTPRRRAHGRACCSASA